MEQQFVTLVIAHRGASAYAPENTLAAFALAADQRADMVELDVQPTVDGAIVVFHDDTTERWNGQQRAVAACTWAELQQVDLRGERVPLLAEVCVLARERGLRLNIELKAAGIGSEVVRIVRQARVGDLVLFSSFSPLALAELAAAAPTLPRAYLMGTRSYRPDVRLRELWPLPALTALDCAAWHPAHELPLLDLMIPLVRQRGVQVNVWTVNDPVRMRQLLAIGVDGIITDTPDVLRTIQEQ
ncbi:MAG: glycerophosphodiester phosphodiesterase [Roseiflexaceae bacterium]|nr:glycerophosphodiester phosphodiesterase [Roseiflexaceae bacterium]